jgi:hypothetical protein
MRQRPRHGYTFDFSTPCPECGYIIQPEELELTGFSKMRCPQCRKEFATRRTAPPSDFVQDWPTAKSHNHYTHLVVSTRAVARKPVPHISLLRCGIQRMPHVCVSDMGDDQSKTRPGTRLGALHAKPIAFADRPSRPPT